MNKRGFTIIETMVSLIIIMIAVIQIASIIIHSVKLNRKTNDIFYINQKAEHIKNLLLSNSYNSKELIEGETKKNDDGYEISWKTLNISDSLKAIQLSIKKKNIKKEYYFLRSKYIN